MVKLKIGVAAAVCLIAVGAMASNFRAADQVYVPAAGHVASSVTFISDVFLSNFSTDPVSVSVIYSSGATGAQQVFNNVITLSANERREILDFLPTTLGLQTGFGQLIFNACKQNGDCNVNTCPNGTTTGICPDFRNISVESRIYSVPNGSNPATAPTNGQLFSGIPWYNFVSSDANAVGLDKVQIVGIRQNTAYRSNIGLINASQYSTTHLLAKLFDGATGAQIGTTYDQPLAPLGQVQVNISQAFPGFSGTNAYVTVEQTNTVATSDAAAASCPDGCPAFFAYGSVADNVTNDATTLEAQYLKSLTDPVFGDPVSGPNPITCIYNQLCKAPYAFVPHRAVSH